MGIPRPGTPAVNRSRLITSGAQVGSPTPTSTHGLLHRCEVAGEGKSRSEAEVPNCSHPNFPPQEEQYHQAIALLFLSRHFYFSLVPVITHVLAAALKGGPRSPVTCGWPWDDPRNSRQGQELGFPLVSLFGEASKRCSWWELNKLRHEIFIHLH